MNRLQPLGWINRHGFFLGCQKPWEHAEIAKRYFEGAENAELIAEEMGWIRISVPSEYAMGCYTAKCALPLNQLQQDTLFEWCEQYGEDFIEFLNENQLTVE